MAFNDQDQDGNGKCRNKGKLSEQGFHVKEFVRETNPLLNTVVLGNLMSFLPAQDLKSCRLLNKFWNHSATKQLRKIAKIKPTSKFFYMRKDDEKFKSFTSDFKKSNNKNLRQLPFSKVKLRLKNTNVFICAKENDCTLFFNMNPKIEQLSLSHAQLIEIHEGEDFREKVCCTSSLNILKLDHPSLSHCKTLKISNMPAHLTSAFPFAVYPRRALRVLEIKMSNYVRGFSAEVSFYMKLLHASPLLERLDFCVLINKPSPNDGIDSNILSTAVIPALMKLKLRKLTHLGLKLKVINNEIYHNHHHLLYVDFTPILPSPEDTASFPFGCCSKSKFKLKSLSLFDLHSVGIRCFLESQANTLEQLSLDYSLKSDINPAQLHSLYLPVLPKLKSLIMPYYYGNPETFVKLGLHVFTTAERCLPKLESLNFTDYRNTCCGRSKNCYPGTWATGPKYPFLLNRIGDNTKIKTFKLNVTSVSHCDCDDDDLLVKEIFSQMHMLENLTIAGASSSFFKRFWITAFRKTLKVLRLETCWIKNEEMVFDSILTGFSTKSCAKINLTLTQYADDGGLEQFNISEQREWVKEFNKQGSGMKTIYCGSIAHFKNLEKLEIANSVSEFTFLYILLSLNHLTSLHLSGGKIRKELVQTVRPSLSLAFNLQIDY